MDLLCGFTPCQVVKIHESILNSQIWGMLYGLKMWINPQKYCDKSMNFILFMDTFIFFTFFFKVIHKLQI